MAYTSVAKATITLTDGRVIDLDGSEYTIIFSGSMSQDSLQQKPRQPDKFEGILRFHAPAEKWDEWRT